MMTIIPSQPTQDIVLFQPDKGFAKFNTGSLDNSSHRKPKTAEVLTIPCPGSKCLSGPNLTWLCTGCDSRLSFCPSDQFIYCNCGRCPYQDWNFNCEDGNHGTEFVAFDSKSFLDAWEDHKNGESRPVEELNILILGRTGVGKSTWINAFMNYLLYPSLDAALAAHELEWLIPFAFRTYSVNDAGEFDDIKVSFGFDEPDPSRSIKSGKNIGLQERDGSSGGSATQQTLVHKIQISNKQLVRLIDTPGIGDTRGASKDKENLADILDVLRAYKDLHGILILLKPNEQRLDLMFKFCIQELLTHLHRDAARNIAFGFTNTRGTNYQPGDSFDPLRQLLKRFDDVAIPLRKDNVYCFDSESFRFLAALKTCGQSMGYIEDNRASWNYSVDEAKRLIDYFRGLKPHRVTSTVNLYETRRRIFAMAQPMATIAEAIRSSILVNNDQIQELTNGETRRKGLEKMLRIKVKTVCAKKTDLPRTTCSHAECIEHNDTGTEGVDGKKILKTVYKSNCHSPCFLSGVPLDSVGDESIRKCWAFNGSQKAEKCRTCEHHWMSHLHVDYIVDEAMREMNDPEVEELLKHNATFRQQKEAAIKSKIRFIDEVRAELKQIREATAKFSVFLKQNAIMPYNDATLEYLDRCIEEELGKVQAGGSRDKLENLKQYRAEYKEEIRVLEEFMEKGETEKMLDQQGVDKLVTELYSLKHYGAMLRDMRNVVDASHSGARRETSRVKRARQHWNNPKPVDKRAEGPVEIYDALDEKGAREGHGFLKRTSMMFSRVKGLFF